MTLVISQSLPETTLEDLLAIPDNEILYLQKRWNSRHYRDDTSYRYALCTKDCVIHLSRSYETANAEEEAELLQLKGCLGLNKDFFEAQIPERVFNADNDIYFINHSAVKYYQAKREDDQGNSLGIVLHTAKGSAVLDLIDPKSMNEDGIYAGSNANFYQFIDGMIQQRLSPLMCSMTLAQDMWVKKVLAEAASNPSDNVTKFRIAAQMERALDLMESRKFFKVTTPYISGFRREKLAKSVQFLLPATSFPI